MGKPSKARRKMLEPRSQTTRQLNRIYRRDRGICQICKKPCKRVDASREHIIEVKYLFTRAEVLDDRNVVLAHKLCNENRSRQPKKDRSEVIEETEVPKNVKIVGPRSPSEPITWQNSIGDLLPRETLDKLIEFTSESD